MTNQRGYPPYAWQAAHKVYNALLRQGRPEADARRDAERWVLGNYGHKVVLPPPQEPRRSTPGPQKKAPSYSAEDAAVVEEVEAWLKEMRRRQEQEKTATSPLRALWSTLGLSVVLIGAIAAIYLTDEPEKARYLWDQAKELWAFTTALIPD